MLTRRQNFIETINGGNPDRLVNGYEAFKVMRGDPVTILDRGVRVRGETHHDVFGTELVWGEDEPGAMPYVTEENKIIKDITQWREQATIPDYLSMDLDWTEAEQAVAEIDRNEYLIACVPATGLFERLHFLMGFEDMFINFLEEPEEMHALLDALLETRLGYMKLVIDHLHPDVIMNHDDWGTKQSLFLNEDLWREFFKERYTKFYGFIRDQGVIAGHHADCYCASIIEDMQEMGIQFWQGVIPSNDLCDLQKKLPAIGGNPVLMGGIDSLVDGANASEEFIRSEVRKACETYGPGGYFIPCLTYGAPGSIYPHVQPIIDDEVNRYNQETYGVCSQSE